MNARRWSVATLGEAHPRVALDANVLIYVLEGASPLGEFGKVLIDAAEEGRFAAAMSVIGVTETLAGFAKAGDARRFEIAADELRELGVAIVPTDSAIAEDAAWLRGARSITLADALHLATARAFGATAFITNDRRLRSISRLEVIYLDDLVA